jgi:hypothetical protein
MDRLSSGGELSEEEDVPHRTVECRACHMLMRRIGWRFGGLEDGGERAQYVDIVGVGRGLLYTALGMILLYFCFCIAGSSLGAIWTANGTIEMRDISLGDESRCDGDGMAQYSSSRTRMGGKGRPGVEQSLIGAGRPEPSV